MTTLKDQIITRLIAQGRSEELHHPNASIYWNGAEDDIRYVCWTCGNTYPTPTEIETHLATSDHSD